MLINKISGDVTLWLTILIASIFVFPSSVAFAAAPSTGLILDLDPALISGLSDGDPAGTLPDAVSGNNATSTDAARPTYRTSLAPFPVLVFDGTNDYLKTNNLGTTNQPFTIFLVFQPRDRSWSKRILDGYFVNSNVLAQAPMDINFFGINWGVRYYSLYAGSAYAAINPGGALLENGSTFGVLRALFNGASSEISVNRNTATIGNPGSAPFNGLTIAGTASQSSGFFSNLYLARVLVYDSNLESASDVEDYLDSQYSLTVPNLLVADGDSLTRGNGASGFHTDLSGNYPSQLLDLLGSSWAMVNAGEASQTAEDMEADAEAQIDPQLNTLSPHKVLTAWGGTNDIYFGASAATAYGNYRTYLENRKAAGWKVIAATILPRSAGATPEAFEADRQAFNENLRNSWTEFADGLADVASDSRIGDEGDELDTAYYNADKVHLNDAGYAVAASIFEAQIGLVIDTVAPSVSITTPAPDSMVSGSSVSFSASASDNLDDLVGVQFKLDTGTDIGSEVTSAPYTVSWDSTTVGNGTHTIVAVARDSAGNYATSTAVSFSVSNSSSSGGGGGGGGGGSSRSSSSSSDDDDDTSTTTDSTDRAALLAQIETLTKELVRLQSLLGVGSSIPSGFTFLTDLSIGSRTDDVQRLQQFLNSKGYIVNARPDGAGAPGRESTYFGDLTREALARFQAANSIAPAVGYFGPITRALVNSLLR